jgi:hypothetical protein
MRVLSVILSIVVLPITLAAQVVITPSGGGGSSPFDPDTPHDWTTQYFSRICFGTEASPTGTIATSANGVFELKADCGATTTTKAAFRLFSRYSSTDPTATNYVRLFNIADAATPNWQLQCLRGDGFGLGSCDVSIQPEERTFFYNGSILHAVMFRSPLSMNFDGLSSIQWPSAADNSPQTGTPSVGLGRHADGILGARLQTGTAVDFNSSGYHVNGNEGASATCASGIAAVTIEGGIITAVTCN